MEHYHYIYTLTPCGCFSKAVCIPARNNGRITMLRNAFWVHKTSLAPPLVIEVPVPSEQLYILYLCFFPLFTNFLLDFGTVPTV